MLELGALTSRPHSVRSTLGIFALRAQCGRGRPRSQHNVARFALGYPNPRFLALSSFAKLHEETSNVIVDN